MHVGISKAGEMQTRHRVRAVKEEAVFFGALPKRFANHTFHAAAIHHNSALFKALRVLGDVIERILRIKRGNHQITRRKLFGQQFVVDRAQQFCFEQHAAVNVRAQHFVFRIVFECLGERAADKA